MAVVNTLGLNITALNTAPQSLVDVGLFTSRVRAQFDFVSIAAADDDTSTFRLARVFSSWRVISIRTACTAITAGTSYDIGLYQTSANGGAVADVDAYGSAIDLSSALNFVEHGFEARLVADTQKRVWENILGANALTADSFRFYDIVYTANTIGSAAGTIQCLLLHTID